MSFMGFLVGLILAVIIFWSYAILIFWPRVIGTVSAGMSLSGSLLLANVAALLLTGRGIHIVLGIFCVGLFSLSTHLEGEGSKRKVTTVKDEEETKTFLLATDEVYGYTRIGEDD